MNSTTRPTFAAAEALQGVYCQTAQAMRTHGYRWHSGEVYGTHASGLPIADHPLQYGMRLTRRQVYTIDRSAGKLLDPQEGLEIRYHEPYYLQMGGHLELDEEQPFTPDNMGIRFVRSSNPPPPLLVRERVGFVALKCRDTSGIDVVSFTVQRGDTVLSFEGEREVLYSGTHFRGAVSGLSALELQGSAKQAFADLDRLTNDEAEALALVAAGVGKLKYVRPITPQAAGWPKRLRHNWARRLLH